MIEKPNDTLPEDQPTDQTEKQIEPPFDPFDRLPDRQTSGMRTAMLIFSVVVVLFAKPASARAGLEGIWVIIFYALVVAGFFIGFAQRDKGRYLYMAAASLLPYAALPLLKMAARFIA